MSTNRDTLGRFLRSGEIALERSPFLDQEPEPLPATFSFDKIDGMMLGLTGALAIARLAAWAVQHDPAEPPIVGALAGGTVGVGGIPADWTAGIIDWPRSVGLLRKVASRLGQQKRDGQALWPVRYFWPAVLPRNVLFLIVVLLHGFRRLAPPY